MSKNFLLGHGERLTVHVPKPPGGGSKNPPYEFSVARSRLANRVGATAAALRTLPAAACPDDEAVALVTLHPRYVSKSDFPEVLLREVGLRPIGSRPRRIKPERWGIEKHPDEATTAAIFVAGPRDAYYRWEVQAPDWASERTGAQQLTLLEDLSAYTAVDKIRGLRTTEDMASLELVLHSGGNPSAMDGLEAYALQCGAVLELSRRRHVNDMWFIPASCPRDAVSALADYAFLRVVRGMPQLRPLRPTILRGAAVAKVSLPTEPPIDNTTRVAIFDGGLPSHTRLATWVRYFEPPGVGPAVQGFEEHGLHVTSAALFGTLRPGEVAPRPVNAIDHYRVLDTGSEEGPFDLVDVLDRITAVLDDVERPYEYVNLSLGPDLAVDDDEVTLWTSALDMRFASPERLLTVAAGNGGQLDGAAGLNRVQPPADAVNALSVGAADSTSDTWNRATYSSVGPGRSPGVMKPDGVAFGGSLAEPFRVLHGTTPQGLAETQGTSFAAPTVLRAGAGVGAVLGGRLCPLAVRALLIHRAERRAVHLPVEFGWGRLLTEVDALITCADDEAHVIYQGELPVGQCLRARVPLPDGALPSKVELAATLCIAPQVDAAHPFSYTRSGIEVTFRPHANQFPARKGGKRSSVAASAPFSRRGRCTATPQNSRSVKAESGNRS